MPRDIPVGNEQYLVMFDLDYQIAEIFYPHVGMENRVLGHPFKFGVYVDDQFSWTNTWSKTLNYLDDALATSVGLRSDEIELVIDCNDCVDFVSPIYLRKVAVRNLSTRSREVRLFFHHDFHIRGNAIGDTAYFDPKSRAVIHYKTDRYFLANCLNQSSEGIFEYACGVKESAGALGTWKDAEDGKLSGNAIAQGSVDSVISSKISIAAGGESSLYYWIAAGKTYDEVQRRDQFVKTRSPQKLLKRTIDFWRLWVLKDSLPTTDLGDRVTSLYRRSLLVTKSQTDGDGAVIAANDTDILQFNKDTYSYMWPRDGAFVTMSLDDAGYRMFASRFFEFCAESILPAGWFFHKYQADKSPGSSWHPWIIGEQKQLPIQEDETALVVLSLWNHFQRYRDVDTIKPFYSPIVKAVGNFMVEYREKVSGLPLDSYDLWEERRAKFTFTCAAVYAGLASASNFARAFGEDDIEARFASAAEEVKSGILEYLYDPSLGRFLRSVRMENGNVVEKRHY
ncbi:MAG: glycoside hydrolase family 15 protein [Nitrososphaerales archaeon]